MFNIYGVIATIVFLMILTMIWTKSEEVAWLMLKTLFTLIAFTLFYLAIQFCNTLF